MTDMSGEPIWEHANLATAKAASLVTKITIASVSARPMRFCQSLFHGEALKKATLILSAFAALWIATTPVAFATGAEVVSPAHAGEISDHDRT
jgi:hypothetical protein